MSMLDSILRGADAANAGAVVRAGNKWYFVVLFNGVRMRWRFDPSAQHPPKVGRANWGGGWGAGLSTVFQNGQQVGWWPSDERAVVVRKGS